MDKLELLDNNFSESMRSLLSDQRYQKVQRLRSSSGKTGSALVYLLLRFALHEAYDINEPVEFEFASKGKPTLKDYPRIHFSLSHSKGVAACVAADFEVGVDVQNIRSVSGKTAKRVLTAKEYEAFLTSSNPDEYFCKIWTIKESYVKMTGQGIMAELGEVSAENISNTYTFRGDNYYCSVCGLIPAGGTIPAVGTVASKSLAGEAWEKVRKIRREDLEQLYK